MTRCELRIITAQLGGCGSQRRDRWLHSPHDGLGIAGDRPRPATGRVLRRRGRTPSTSVARPPPCRRAAVVEQTDPAPRAAAGCPAAGSHVAGHAGHRSRRGLPAAGQGLAALGRPSHRAGQGRRPTEPHHDRLHHGLDRHPGGARVAPRASRRQCASLAPRLGPSARRAARSSSGCGGDSTAVSDRPAARHDPL